MLKAVLAVTLAMAGVVSSVNTASAACTYGSFSAWTTVMNGSFNSGYTECSVSSWAGVFRARTWMHGTCQLGSGCRSASVRRSDSLCIFPGIGVDVRGNIVNYATGVVTQNSPIIVNNNYACNNQLTQSQPAPHQWLLGVRCRIGHTC